MRAEREPRVTFRRLVAVVAVAILIAFVLNWRDARAARPWRIKAARDARLATWSCERTAGLARSAYPAVRWRLAVPTRRLSTLLYWRGRLRACHRAVNARPAHYLGWLCIHRGEGAWNANTGNGFYGGLQAHYNWYGVARMDLLSPLAQMRHAERVARSVGFSSSWLRGQWPNTYPGCAVYF